MKGLLLTMIRELLVGDNPFIGVSHLSQEKSRSETVGLSTENKIKVFEAAVSNGATGFTFSTHRLNLELLTALKSRNEELFSSMNYYVLVPYAQSYAREANMSGTPTLALSLVTRMLGRVPLRDLLTPVFCLRPEKLLGAFIKADLQPYLDLLPADKIKAILLHEIITELIIAFNMMELLRFLDGYVKSRIKSPFGLETRNLGHLCRVLSTNGYWPEYIMTPINPLGYQMAPDKKTVEGCIEEFGSRTKIIAINILASGALSLDNSIDYLKKYEKNLYAVTSASAKPHRAYENFCELSRILLHGKA